MKWSFFLGACLLTAAGLLPHAPAQDILVGMLLAGVVTWWWQRHEIGRNE